LTIVPKGYEDNVEEDDEDEDDGSYADDEYGKKKAPKKRKKKSQPSSSAPRPKGMHPVSQWSSRLAFVQPYLGTTTQIQIQNMDPDRKRRNGLVFLETNSVSPAEAARFPIILMMSKLSLSFQKRTSIKGTMSILPCSSKKKTRLSLS
jgi:hypothetical protein